MFRWNSSLETRKSIMLLQEIFNTKVNIEWNSSYETATFFIKEKKYVVRFEPAEHDDFLDEESMYEEFGVEFEFVAPDVDGYTNKMSYGINNKGDALRVFSNVGRIVHEFLTKAKFVSSLSFAATEPNRAKLYYRMIPKLLNQLPGWEFSMHHNGLMVEFMVFNPKTIGT